MPYALPSLPYAPDALEPYYDKATLKLHHDKHHRAYVDNLNEALKGHPDWESKSITDLLVEADSLPESIHRKVVNNAGGHFNHTLFWNIMGPGKGGAPGREIGEALESSFRDFKSFQTQWKKAALDVFGSGWTFLVAGENGQLEIRNYANQDCPVAENLRP